MLTLLPNKCDELEALVRDQQLYRECSLIRLVRGAGPVDDLSHCAVEPRGSEDPLSLRPLDCLTVLELFL